MQDYTLKPLFTAEQIRQKTIDLSRELSADYAHTCPLIIGVLKGSFVFLADIIRHLTMDVTIDFVQISSYGPSQISSENCILVKDITSEVSGRDVLIVEDIIDTGYTVHFLIERLRARNPRSIKTCSLIDKKPARKQAVTIDYCGFSIDDVFIVGFGLDYDERFRALPAIYELHDGNI